MLLINVTSLETLFDTRKEFEKKVRADLVELVASNRDLKVLILGKIVDADIRILRLRKFMFALDTFSF